MTILKTIKIKSSETPDGYLVINESDYNPAKHTLLDKPPSPDIEKPPSLPFLSEETVEEKKPKSKVTGS